ncbi:TPA: TerB family tellurite resistance protein [Vibrio metschnikovii]|uniref:TerB family tellurite resistance protein n=3 Tax=Bacteria TaxID=2 RepID=A0AAU6TL40_UNCXX|nr:MULTISPECIES: TerB family tellurite resistance protein [Vibrio]EKO3571320.1 TerB family tellurite resistance protein [Vibrio metschnikovii]EKO3589968.1 TerB family tellurite resistance protein [Vibrio metschnikovii]EKO3607474.1 TerB family tellurite resistance protein [Vibrio metschnikovii]EKO3609497.1 TerB family tellurite resistance protein [Vibrio metschnikovii]EKO3654488.1 TerB family tellurite resistance protein [Vibrio metschnikovii]
MFNTITALFKQLLDGHDLSQPSPSPNFAIACLLSEVAGSDQKITPTERQAKLALLQRLLAIDDSEAQALISRAEQQIRQSASLYEFTSQLRELTQGKRFELIKAMWEVAHADGEIDPLEDAVIRKTAELLYVDHSQFIRAKLMVVNPKK